MWCMGRRTVLFRRAHLGAPSMQQRMARRAQGRRRFKARAPSLLQGCNARARGSLRRHIRGKPVERARRKARATAGTHSGRGRPPARPMCRGDSKRLGARGSAWPCVSEVAAAVRGRFQLKNWSRARACQGISWNCVNGFATVRKRLVQANACSGRPRRDPPLGCGADGPAQHGPPRGRSRDRALLNSIDARLPRCSGSLPCQRGAHSVRRRMSLSVLRAARGQRVLCGTEWTLCAPTGGAALPGSAASLVPAARAAALARERARVRPQPIQYTAHARAAASAVRCEPRVRRCAHSVGRAAARVFRAGPSLGRWRCGSCAFRPWNRGVARGSAGYLVDPASSHMLVSKIKPCMSKYKRLVL